MDRSSGVDPSELYDGPRLVEDHPITLPSRREPARDRAEYVATITAALDVLNARLIAVIAAIAACAMWGWAVYEPEILRTYAAIGFSLTVLAPIVMLYWKRG